MTIWLPDLSGIPGPRYRAIASALAVDIKAGRLAPGARLPTHRDLAYKLGITVGTVSRAYAEAERIGLTEGEVGRGTFVKGARQQITNIMLAPETPSVGSLDLTHASHPVAFAASHFQRTVAEISASDNIDDLVNYQLNTGTRQHLEAGSKWLAKRGLRAPVERVAITNGAQNALMTTLMTITRPGDTVLVEPLTFPGFHQIALRLGLKIETVSFDDGGVIPETIEVACRRHAPRAIYLTPSQQNPTTARLNNDRRREIAEIARRHHLFIIEDDVWSALLDDPFTPLATLVPELTFHISGLSKCLIPGLRIAYVLSPDSHANEMRTAIRLSHWMTPPLMAEIASRWINNGDAEAIVEHSRATMKSRTAVAKTIFGDHVSGLGAIASYLWLRLPPPWRADDFKAEAEARNVLVLTAEPFAVGREAAPHAVRACIGAQENFADVESGLNILAEMLNSTPIGSSAIV